MSSIGPGGGARVALGGEMDPSRLYMSCLEDRGVADVLTHCNVREGRLLERAAREFDSYTTLAVLLEPDAVVLTPHLPDAGRASEREQQPRLSAGGERVNVARRRLLQAAAVSALIALGSLLWVLWNRLFARDGGALETRDSSRAPSRRLRGGRGSRR